MHYTYFCSFFSHIILFSGKNIHIILISNFFLHPPSLSSVDLPPLVQQLFFLLLLVPIARVQNMDSCFLSQILNQATSLLVFAMPLSLWDCSYKQTYLEVRNWVKLFWIIQRIIENLTSCSLGTKPIWSQKETRLTQFRSCNMLETLSIS